jgi:hypothetical protein
VGVLPQVAFEASTGEQAGIIAITGDEHERTGFAVRRAGRVHEDAYREGITCGALTVEQRKKRI